MISFRYFFAINTDGFSYCDHLLDSRRESKLTMTLRKFTKRLVYFNCFESITFQSYLWILIWSKKIKWQLKPSKNKYRNMLCRLQNHCEFFHKQHFCRHTYCLFSVCIVNLFVMVISNYVYEFGVGNMYNFIIVIVYVCSYYNNKLRL